MAESSVKTNYGASNIKWIAGIFLAPFVMLTVGWLFGIFEILDTDNPLVTFTLFFFYYFLPSIILASLAPIDRFGKIIILGAALLIDPVLIFIFVWAISCILKNCTSF